MPVHPVLAAMLAEWKLRGWPAMIGRGPGPDDLVVPLPPFERVRLKKPRPEPMRNKGDSFKRLSSDLKAMGLRHRRGHDLRRTMISLALEDGARKDLLEICTHNPGRAERAIDGYISINWRPLCDEIAKLKIQRRQARGQLVALPRVDTTADQPAP